MRFSVVLTSASVEDIAVDYAGTITRRFRVKPWAVFHGRRTVESAQIDRDGGFELQGLHRGMFVLTFYRGSKILAMKPMEMDPPGRIK